MKGFDRVSLRGSLLCLAIAAPLHSQQAADVPPQSELRVSTQERIDSEAWWPTKTTLPLRGFAGSAACSKCHLEESAAQTSSMRRAAQHTADARFFDAIAPPTSTALPLTYRISTAKGVMDLSVSDGLHTLSTQLDWIIGAGDLGRTFLYQKEGRWYQSEASFYTQPASLDVTTGIAGDRGVSLPFALGQVLSKRDAISCFGCHTVHATTSSGFDPLHAEAGLGCEACHGPAKAHADAGDNASSTPGGLSTVFNPARLSPSDSIDFCGACHRTFADATLSANVNTTTVVVRFQPYRLQESACWRSTRDARLTCVACHDPHKPLDRNLASYDGTCIQCHSAPASKGLDPARAGTSAKSCDVASSGCVSCHMPKVAVASMHGDFTDHFIRVARPGDPFPK